MFETFECSDPNWNNVGDWCNYMTSRIAPVNGICYEVPGTLSNGGYTFIKPECAGQPLLNLSQCTDIFNGDQIACEFFKACISRDLSRQPVKFNPFGFPYNSFFQFITYKWFSNINNILIYQGNALIPEDDTGLKLFTEASKKVCGSVFKMHLQIKKEYLSEFSYNFAKFLLQSGLINIAKDGKIIGKIKEFKIYYKPSNGTEPQDERFHGVMPRIVIYLTEKYLPDLVVRHNYLNAIVDPILKFVNQFCVFKNITLQDLAWPYPPRMNYKINDVVYIAGDNADYKIAYKECITNISSFQKCDDVILINDFYTSDFNFVTGFEYQYFPPNQRNANRV